MRNKLYFIPLVILSLFLTPFIIMSPGVSGTVQAQSHEIVKIDVMTSAFGSNTYTYTLGLANIFKEKHPWLRINHAEGPGCTATAYHMAMGNPGWEKRIGCCTINDYWMARHGFGPFEGKPIPNIEEIVKAAGVYMGTAIMFYSMDPEIKTIKDLEGKRIAMGRRGQTAWSQVPTLVLERMGIKAKIEYLSPNEATAAMMDGRVDAAALTVPTSPDGSEVVVPGALNNFLAARKTPYYVDYGEETVERAKAEGWEGVFIPWKLPAGSLPQQKNTIWVGGTPVPLTMHKNFPADLAYEFSKCWAQNSYELVEYLGMAVITKKPEWIASSVVTQEMAHPGTWKAWKELGLR